MVLSTMRSRNSNSGRQAGTLGFNLTISLAPVSLGLQMLGVSRSESEDRDLNVVGMQEQSLRAFPRSHYGRSTMREPMYLALGAYMAIARSRPKTGDPRTRFREWSKRSKGLTQLVPRMP